MRYAVVPLASHRDPEGLQKRIREVDGAAYTHYHPTIYFVSFSGTAEDLSKRIQFGRTDGQPSTPGIVIGIEGYYGFGEKNLWDWLGSKK